MPKTKTHTKEDHRAAIIEAWNLFEGRAYSGPSVKANRFLEDIREKAKREDFAGLTKKQFNFLKSLIVWMRRYEGKLACQIIAERSGRDFSRAKNNYESAKWGR